MDELNSIKIMYRTTARKNFWRQAIANQKLVFCSATDILIKLFGPTPRQTDLSMDRFSVRYTVFNNES